MLDQLWLPLTKFVEFGVSYKEAKRIVEEHALDTRRPGGKGGAILAYAPEVVQVFYTESRGKLDYNQEQALLAQQRRYKLELEMDVMRRDLVSLEQIEEWAAAAITAARARLLSLPTKSAPVVASMVSEPEIQAVLMEHVRDALNELASLEVMDGTAIADDQRVGRPEPDVESRGERGAGPVEH